MKKKFFKRTAALIMILFLVLPLTLPDGTANGAVRNSMVSLGAGTTLAKSISYSPDAQNENYFIYTPNDTITPVVVYGSKLCNYGNFDSMAALLTNKGYNVIGGINGDFYELATYQPIGIVITDGILRSSDAGHWAIGFKADGTAFIDKPALSMRVKIGTENYKLGGINKVRTGGEYYLFTEDFSYTTKNLSPGRDVILSFVPPADGSEYDGKLRTNCSLTLRVEEIRESNSEIALPPNRFVLSLAKSSDEWRQYGIDHLSTGDIITLEISSDPKWDSVEHAIGSYAKLVTNGKKDSTIPTDSMHTNANPRTAAGIKADGTVILYTIDGRQSGYSTGLSSAQVAERLIELGCTEAILLDGGGSTNLHALYIGSDNPEQINKPSDGSERSVSNYVMLVAKNPGSGSVQNIGVYPFDALILAGSESLFSAGASDETSRKVSTPPVSWSLSGNAATISDDGLFRAGNVSANLFVYADYGSIRGSASVSIIEKPTEITILNEKTNREIATLGVIAGETIDLKASSFYQNLPVLSSDDAYSWSLSEGIGTISINGSFTASEFSGNGTISVNAGGTTASIDVIIRSESEIIENFESGTIKLSSSETAEISRVTERDYVKNGYGSAEIRYTLTDGEAYIPALLTVGTQMNYISFFLNSDGSGNAFGIIFEDDSRSEATIMDFNAWHQAVVKLPFKGCDIKGFYITGTIDGTIYLDQIMASTSPEPDTLPPDIDIQITNLNVVSGFVLDASDGAPDKSFIELTYDGTPLDFNLNSSSGKISAVLPLEIPESNTTDEDSRLPEGVHKLTLRANDKSGNISTRNILIEGQCDTAFYDMQNHWSSIYVNYMYSTGVVTGIETESGLIYDPDSPVTRAQFAVMIARYLKLDLSAYDSINLDFADTETIPDYALPAVKAVYSLGIIKGMSNNGLKYFEPDSTLSRAQAMTIAGRIQPGGFHEYPLPFPDSGDIPSWALRYVISLSGQGVISGTSDGSLLPNAPLTRAQVAKILSEI